MLKLGLLAAALILAARYQWRRVVSDERGTPDSATAKARRESETADLLDNPGTGCTLCGQPAAERTLRTLYDGACLLCAGCDDLVAMGRARV